MSKQLSELLRELRTKNHMTQGEVAAILGLKPNAYQSYERGVSEPSCSSLRILASFYNVTTDYLLGLDDEDPISLTHSDKSLEEAILTAYRSAPEEVRRMILDSIRQAVREQDAAAEPAQMYIEKSLGEIEDENNEELYRQGDAG